MEPPSISTRLQYLNDSAHMLATTAPSTSAYLMSRCNSLMFHNGVEPTDNHRRRICVACGNIMILGWTGTRQLESLGVEQRKRGPKPAMRGSREGVTKTIVYKCERCDRRTRINIDSNIARHTRTSMPKTSLKESLESSPTISPSSASANAGSKRRAKARKQGGLQALLAKNKDSGAGGRLSGGFGLGLLDLMKKA